ncbi:MAG TPA: YigZ family protein [Ignavibacteriaceae bacterium]|nr:YigZ family protein [Ignavibacteriaceae bacterium]
MNNIKTIKEPCEAKLREKGSLFIGKGYPVDSEKEIRDKLPEIKKKYYDATHHCYAYKLFPENFKYSDAGEPAGSAGIRILNAIEHSKLVNILIVVIRYFGGTKLGIGPLGKAYYNTALMALERSKLMEKTAAKKVLIKVDISFANQLAKITAASKAQILNSKFEEEITQECMINAGMLEQFTSRLKESTKDAAEIIIDGKTYFV